MSTTIITGAGSGIGEATACRLAADVSDADGSPNRPSASARLTGVA